MISSRRFFGPHGRAGIPFGRRPEEVMGVSIVMGDPENGCFVMEQSENNMDDDWVLGVPP